MNPGWNPADQVLGRKLLPIQQMLNLVVSDLEPLRNHAGISSSLTWDLDNLYEYLKDNLDTLHEIITVSLEVDEDGEPE